MRIDAHYHWLVGPGDLRFEREKFDLDQVGADEVFCRTVVSAISPGTELAAFSGLEPLRANVPAYPRWLGYMNLAEVIRSGSNASADYPRGTLIYCHAAHRSHFCLNKQSILASVPRRIDAASASLAYLYRLAWTGLRRGGVPPGGKVAVVGLGAIGQCAVEIAAKFYGSCLAVSDHLTARHSAEQFGVAAVTRDEAERRFIGTVAEEKALADLVLVTTNGWRDWQIALALARYGGIISVIGFPGRGQGSPQANPFSPAYFYDRQLTVMSAGRAGPYAGDGLEDPAASKRDIAQILEWIDMRTIKPSRLCMGVHPAPDLAGAYERLKSPGRSVGTLVLDWKDL